MLAGGLLLNHDRLFKDRQELEARIVWLQTLTRFDSCGVEQVVDQAAKTVALLIDNRMELVSLLRTVEILSIKQGSNKALNCG